MSESTRTIKKWPPLLAATVFASLASAVGGCNLSLTPETTAYNLSLSVDEILASVPEFSQVLGQSVSTNIVRPNIVLPEPDPGYVIELSLDSGATWQTLGEGENQFTPEQDLSDGVHFVVFHYVRTSDFSVSLDSDPVQVTVDTSAPVVTSFEITTVGTAQNPAETPTIEISVARPSGAEPVASWCILENSSDSIRCHWNTGEIPSTYTLNDTTTGTKTLSLWIRDTAENMSAEIHDSIEYLSNFAPGSLLITTTSPTSDTALSLTHGSYEGSPTDYCILINQSVPTNCGWIALTGGALPTSFGLPEDSANGTRILSLWLKDSLHGDVISSRAESNPIIYIREGSDPIGSILNVNFGANAATYGKAAGPGATGDYWNPYYNPWKAQATISGLKTAAGESTDVSVTVGNAPGQWGNNTNGFNVTDPMFISYLYPWDGQNISLSVAGLPSGTYDFYLYGHGAANDQNSAYSISSAGNSYAAESTLNGAGWESTTWAEGKQYVRLSAIVAVSGQPVLVTVAPGASSYAVLNGMQIVSVVAGSVSGGGSGGGDSPAGALSMNIDFGYRYGATEPNDYASDMTGAAVVGTAGNFWNGIEPRTSGSVTVSSLKDTAGNSTALSATVSGADGVWGTYAPHIDQMWQEYIYSHNNNIIVTLTGIPGGAYDFYIYGQGEGSGHSSVFSIDSDGIGTDEYGTKTTLGTIAPNLSTYIENSQYVKFTGVVVTAGTSVRISVLPGVSTDTILNGLQIVPSGGGDIAGSSEKIINIDFQAASSIGHAAGPGTDLDFWNAYSHYPNGWQGVLVPNGSMSNLKTSDNTTTPVSVAVSNAAGGWGISTPGNTDPMFMGYMYPNPSGSITVTLSDLEGGLYDFYLYGHGDATNQNSAFSIDADNNGTVDSAPKKTLNGSGWNSATWTENTQYVKFGDVTVTAGTPVKFTVAPDASSYAALNGMQIVKKSGP